MQEFIQTLKKTKQENNNNKNMVTPEPSCHSTERIDHSNPDEADKHSFKSNFLRMMD